MRPKIHPGKELLELMLTYFTYDELATLHAVVDVDPDDVAIAPSNFCVSVPMSADHDFDSIASRPTSPLVLRVAQYDFRTVSFSLRSNTATTAT